jgi:hypothetical protein
MQAARGAQLIGTYVGWLGTDASTWATRLRGAKGWLRTDGKLVATDSSQISYVPGASQWPHLIYPLTADEHGHAVSPSTQVISGISDYCSNWDPTIKGVSQNVGLAGGSWIGAGLSAATTDPCGTPEHVYCFGTDYAAVLPPAPHVVGRIAFLAGQSATRTGGVAGLDALCAEAASFYLTGTFVALVATTTAPASSRLSASGAPWVRVDGVPIVATAADLFAAGGPNLIAPLDLDASGRLFWSSVLTGAPDFQSVGTPDSTCHDYTDASAASGKIVGNSTYPNHVMVDEGSAQLQECQYSNAVYCLQK